ncbi:MAG: SLBB domain-containing protein [Fimbriimonadales bacterium]
MNLRTKQTIGVLLLACQVFATNRGVNVTGEVRNPGVVSFREGLRLKEVISLAGGLKDGSDPYSVTIRSENETRTIDLTQLGPSPLVQPGATVTINRFDPRNYITVKGAMSKVGNVRYRDGMTLKDALTVGSPYTDACLDSVFITSSYENGNVTKKKVDLTKVEASAVALNASDVVEVPFARGWAASDRELLTVIVIGLLVLVIVSR